MSNDLSRRTFLQLGAVTAGALVVGQMLPPAVAQAAQDAGMVNTQGDGFVPSMCEMCVWRCGLIAKVKNGRVVKLDGNPDHPHSRGHLCVRGQSGLFNTYDPDRITTPLIRVGNRGEGRFRRASWDEALDLTASNMLAIREQYGAQAMVFSSTHNLSQVQFENLLYAYGSPNYGTQRSLCFNAMIVANLMTYGLEEPERIYDDQLSYIILTGRNLMEAVSTSETGELSEAIARGAHVVYLDPRFTKTAAKASEWLPIKPGTDLAFHLALLNVIIGEDLYNHAFVAQYTLGLEQVAEEVARYTPEWAAPITGIDADRIRRIARDFAAAAPHALAHNGWRTSNFVNSFQTQRAITVLNALVGNWNVTLRAGGGESSGALGTIPQPPYPRISAQRLDHVPSRFPVVPLKIGVFQELRDSIISGEPYQAHGWFIARQNPVMSLPDRARTLQAFEKLDFIATVDIVVNDTAWFSDVILPEASYLERYDPLLPVGDRVYIRQPVIEPQGEARSALWIYKQLGERLGLGDYFQYADEEDYIRQQLAPLGVTLEEIRARGYVELPPHEEAGFNWNTPSGKIELYSETLDRVGFAGVPAWEAPPEPPSGQFYLLTGKVAQATQFGTQNNRMLHKVADEPRLWLNDSVAADRGMVDGDWVEVSSAVGSVHIRLHVTPAIRPDCVYLTPGYGHLSQGLTTAFGVGASDSVLHVTYTDPVSGSQALTQTFVTVRKV
ncbi:MAG: molybdopterin-dependent oxidoreductase [Anaerolinea sp.]|nr:molybdopterin-dependent oxidoreductase [Anaerolinea sp.]